MTDLPTSSVSSTLPISPQWPSDQAYLREVAFPMSNSNPLTVNQVVSHELQQAVAPAKHQALYAQVSEEEHQAVIEKMITAVRQPAGHLPRQDELYLEQQLTDMLGFEVTSELEGVTLNHSIGVMSAQPHLKRHPTDELPHHDVYREAGLSEFRSSFGWFTELGQLTPLSIQREKYCFTVQAEFLPNWSTEFQKLKPWFKYRKMLMINPVAQKAVVGVVGDLGPGNWLQEQFGGSPEVIREGEVWNLESQGRVMLLFINDLHQAVPLGPLSLRYNTLVSQ